MAQVRFTRNLLRFFPSLRETDIDGKTVKDVIAQLDSHYPGIIAYIVDEKGALRQHVNIFVDGKSIVDRDALSDRLSEGSVVHIFQALSGG